MEVFEFFLISRNRIHNKNLFFFVTFLAHLARFVVDLKSEACCRAGSPLNTTKNNPTNYRIKFAVDHHNLRVIERLSETQEKQTNKQTNPRHNDSKLLGINYENTTRE